MNKSEALYNEAVRYMPAGVNSPVRAFRSVGGTPIFMARGEGAYVEDVDGKRYLDFCGSWGPLVLGHCHPKVQQAIQEVVQKGWTFGTPVPEEVKLAKLIAERLSAVDMVRFVNSGTEAVMSAIRLARGFTKRDRVLKFRGCYHGHVDYLLIEAGSGLATFGTASSDGVPSGFTRETATMPLDSLDYLETLFRQSGQELACVVIEGVPANNGLLIQDHSYVRRLRELCDAYDTLLIFDEVLSGFRLPEVMAYERYGVKPDLVTLGKVIGGGMPVGAYGGRKEIMACVSPLGNVYQAGTLSGNPVAMAAGYATLRAYFDSDVPAQIEKLGRYLEEKVEAVFTGLNDIRMVRVGSLFWFYFYRNTPPKRAEDISDAGSEAYAKLHRFMLDQGIYLAPSSYEVGFLNTAQTLADLDTFANALETAKKEGFLT